MAASKTQAFVLKTQDYRDTSLLVHFYTQDFGKLHGIIKGIRDSRGRFGGTLEPFSLNEILVYRRRRGGDLHQVTGAELLDSFPALREDLERLSYASYFAELVNQLVEAEEPNAAIFDLLNESLRFLSTGVSPKRAARIFEVKLLALLGLMPEIEACVVCQKKPPAPVFFSVTHGGIHCKSCEVQGEAGIPVSRGALNFLEHVRRSEIRDLGPIKVSQEVGREVEKILRRFVDFQLPGKLRSVVFLEKMGLN